MREFWLAFVLTLMLAGCSAKWPVVGSYEIRCVDNQMIRIYINADGSLGSQDKTGGVLSPRQACVLNTDGSFTVRKK